MLYLYQQLVYLLQYLFEMYIYIIKYITSKMEYLPIDPNELEAKNKEKTEKKLKEFRENGIPC